MNVVYEWWTTPYARDIISYMRELENNRRLYESHSPQLSRRGEIVTFMCEQAREMSFCNVSAHLAVYLMDRFMDNHDISEEQIKPVALVCMVIAGKMEERGDNTPMIKDVLDGLPEGHVATKLKLIALEIFVLEFFEWNVLVPTVIQFLEYYAVEALCRQDCIETEESPTKHRSDTDGAGDGDNEVVTYLVPGKHHLKSYNSFYDMKHAIQAEIFHLAEQSLHSTELINVKPSLLAASIVAKARANCGMRPVWPKSLQVLTKYAAKDILETLNALMKLLGSRVPKEPCVLLSHLTNLKLGDEDKERERD